MFTKMKMINRNIKYWRSRLLRITILLIILSGYSIGHAQNLFNAPEISAKMSIDTNSIQIGEQTNIHLQLTSPENIKIHWPIIQDTLTKNIEVIHNSVIDTVFNKDKKTITLKQNITITSFDSGYFAIPPFYFMYGNDSTPNFVESNALLLHVQDVKIDLKGEIKDIKPILDEPWTFKEILPYILIALGVLVALALIIYIIQRRKQNKPLFKMPEKPKIPAHILALQKLKQLQDKKLWQTGSVKEFYSELTDILREYMEGQLHFNAMEMISDEIIDELKSKKIDNSLIKETQDVLQTADLVKFAKIKPLADENDRALNWGFHFVEATKPSEAAKKEDENNVEPSKSDAL